MKTYKDFETVIVFENNNIPKDLSNRDYQQFLEEQRNGEAELIPYTLPAITWDQIRLQRDRLLTASDWVVLKDTNIQNEQAWLDYRQALRDLPQTFSNPDEVIWPTKPQ